MSSGNLLADMITEPARAVTLTTEAWDLLLRMARTELVLGRLGYLLEEAGVGESRCPPPAWAMLRAARAYPQFLQVRARREIRAILRATAHLGTEFILLKGAAYLKAGLPVGCGRLLSDVDLLVRRDQLAAVEEALLARGWEPQKLNAYDQRYYREWMHEIPPLRHRERAMEVDIHHRILPLTSRLNPDPELLWQASVPLEEPRLRVLAPADMILHSATHLFYDGEMKDGFKELLDLHQMFLHFGAQGGLWAVLPERARRLDLERPLYYAVTFCSRLLRTPIPPRGLAEVQRGAPGPIAGALANGLIGRVLAPSHPEGRGAPVSAWLLYVRSHWLRMPPWLLAKHLARKGWRRLTRQADGPGERATGSS